MPLVILRICIAEVFAENVPDGGKISKGCVEFFKILANFGCLLFNYPLLSLFNIDDRLFGIPLLYAYIFAAWALLIALIAMVVERNTK